MTEHRTDCMSLSAAWCDCATLRMLGIEEGHPGPRPPAFLVYPHQGEIAAWLEETFGPTRDVHLQALKLAGETGEACEAIVKRADGIPGPPEGWDARLRDELADVVLSALAIASTEGFDLGTAVADKWARVRAKYSAYNLNGDNGDG